jgi:hypothetical protein
VASAAGQQPAGAGGRHKGMRALHAPAAAGLAVALLGTAALMGCGAAHPAHPGAAKADRTKPATAVSASHPAAPGAGQASDRLTAIAFTSPAQGYGMFWGQRPRRCPILAGPTHDGGARFAPLVTVTTYPCGQNPPGTWMAADDHGDVFLYYPRFYVSHDGGRRWAARHEPGPVLAVAAIGRSVWMVYADCRRSVRAAAHGCVLHLLKSADGGWTWAPSPAQPPGATARSVGGTVVTGGAWGQTWLLRTGASSAYLLSSPGQNGTAPLWFTADGGASWAQRQIPCGLAMSITLSAAPDGTLMAVCAGEPTAGYQMKSAARSTDGGLTWAVHPACPPPHLTCRGDALDFGYLGQIAAVTSRTTYLAGYRSSLLVTADGGAHWRPVQPVIGDTGGGTFQVTFFSRRDGIALGDDGRNNELPTIWNTTDGGRHWSRVAVSLPRPTG